MATQSTSSVYQSAPTPPEIHPAESVEDPELRVLLEYWNRRRDARPMPARADISPRDIVRSLRYIHIYEVVEGGRDFRARLVGTSVYQGLDQDQTGRLISEHPDPGVRLRFAMLLHHVFATAAPARSVSRRVTGNIMTDVRTEGLWLPLGEDGTVDQILVQSSIRPMAPG
jgi:hypothetical protein